MSEAAKTAKAVEGFVVLLVATLLKAGSHAAPHKEAILTCGSALDLAQVMLQNVKQRYGISFEGLIK